MANNLIPEVNQGRRDAGAPGKETDAGSSLIEVCELSLFYGLKDPAAKSAETGPFTVTVEDKTRKAEIRK